MLPLTRSRNRSRFFGIPFSPSSLFAAGEQGAWYDPSDYGTLFTDSAGTTPVTAVEQFVGLMLDKSAPVAQTGYYSGFFSGYGADVADNAAFTLGSADFTIEFWVRLSSTSGRQIVAAQSNNSGLNTSISFFFEKTSGNNWSVFVCSGATAYSITSATSATTNWTHIAAVRSGNTMTLYVNGVADGTANVTGVTVNDSSDSLRFGNFLTSGGVAPFTGYLSNFRIVKGIAVYTGNFAPSTVPLTAISGTSFLTFQNNYFKDNGSNALAVTPVGAVPNLLNPFNATAARSVNNAFQTTSAKRPKLAARYNLLTRTEEFDDGAWTKFQSTVTSNAAVAPNGTTTADKLIPNNGAITGFTYNTATPAIPVGTGATASVWVKAAELGFAWVVCNVRASSSTTGVCVNLSTGALTNGGANGTYTVADAGNGWWRVTCTATGSSGIGYLEVWPLAAAGVNGTYTGNGTDGVLIWGADLRPASQATGLIGPTYQRVAAATVYDTAGFLPYLAFDGLSWSMGTNSINFSAGDKVTVWAGARKNQDQFQILSEFSTDLTSNNGAFGIYPGTVNIGSFGARGTTFRQADSAIGAWGTPATVVLCGQANIAQPSASIRVNGTQSNNTASLGTGNFGNYPLFIGARNNASLFFNGWLSSLIVRGAQSTQSQIEATEAWVNGKTGAF